MRVIEKRLATLPLITHARLDEIRYVAETQYGNPYAVALVTADDGNRYTALADAKEFNLDHLPLLTGEDIKLSPTEKGLRIDPQVQQPDRIHEVLIERLEAGPEPDPSRVRVPVIRDEAPPEESKPEQTGDGLPSQDQLLQLVPHLHSLIASVGRTAQGEGLICAGWVFIPPIQPC